jgi:hypothetical protein
MNAHYNEDGRPNGDPIDDDGSESLEQGVDDYTKPRAKDSNHFREVGSFNKRRDTNHLGGDDDHDPGK